MTENLSPTVCWPVKLNDNYTCQGVAANGEHVVFEDLLSEGDEVASLSDGQGNVWGPMHTVVRKEDGLWIE